MAKSKNNVPEVTETPENLDEEMFEPGTLHHAIQEAIKRGEFPPKRKPAPKPPKRKPPVEDAGVNDPFSPLAREILGE